MGMSNFVWKSTWTVPCGTSAYLQLAHLLLIPKVNLNYVMAHSNPYPPNEEKNPKPKTKPHVPKSQACGNQSRLPHHIPSTAILASGNNHGPVQTLLRDNSREGIGFVSLQIISIVDFNSESRLVSQNLFLGRFRSKGSCPKQRRYSVFKSRYKSKWQNCLPFRSQSQFAECNDCFNIKQSIRDEKATT